MTRRPLADRRVEVKIVLSGLWVAMLFVFAYVDIFAYLRADVLRAALRGKVATTSFTVNQTFLAYSLVYVTVPALMVVLSLVLRARANRITNIVVSAVYVLTIIVAAAGEDHVYYLIGSLVEIVLLVAIAWTAWTWPPPTPPAPTDGPSRARGRAVVPPDG